MLKATGDQLLALLPDDPDGILAKFKKHKPGAVDETAPPDADQEPKAAPATPSPPVKPNAHASQAQADAAPAPDDKHKLDALVKGAH